MSAALAWSIAAVVVAVLGIAATAVVRAVNRLMAVADGLTKAQENAPNHPGEM